MRQELENAFNNHQHEKEEDDDENIFKDLDTSNMNLHTLEFVIFEYIAYLICKSVESARQIRSKSGIGNGIHKKGRFKETFLLLYSSISPP